MKRTTIGVLIGGALMVGVIAWNNTRTRPVAVTLASVSRGDVRATVSNTRAGTVNTCNRARMAPIMGGQIARLPVSEGDAVKAGDILVELWNADARAQLLLAERERETAKARASEACAASTVANRDAQRIESLYQQGLVSDEQADTVLGQAEARSAACQAMRSMITVSDAKVTLAEAHLEQTIIRAPFDGTVAEINGAVGEVVIPSPVGVATLPAVDLIDNSCIFVTAPIDEVDAPEIQAGMNAAITLDAFPGQSFAGTVRRVAPYVLDREKQARTVDIEARFNEPSDIFLPGYSADIEVILDAHENTLRIPTEALIDDDQVLIINDQGILETRIVSTGLANWQVTEVTSGLEENQRIVLSINRDGVVAGAAAVEDGARQ